MNETSIRENFSILLQLLDEMVDGGFPLTTELTQLKEMILPPSLARRLFANVMSSDSTTGFSSAISADLPTHALSKIPWRKVDIKYVTNEIYFDMVSGTAHNLSLCPQSGGWLGFDRTAPPSNLSSPRPPLSL